MSATLNLKMVDSLPIVRLPGYSFRNEGGYQFTNTSRDWGFTHPSFSNGAAYADLDNDGDLDLVINNVDDNAFVYENTLYSAGAGAAAGAGDSGSPPPGLPVSLATEAATPAPSHPPSPHH